MAKNKAHRKAKVSTNSRKNMKRPTKSPKIVRFQTEPIREIPVQIIKTQPKPEPIEVEMAGKSFDMVKVNRKMKERTEKQAPAPKTTLTAKEIKEQEIQKAMAATNRSIAQSKKSHRHYKKMDFGFRRTMLAMACAAVAVFAIVYFVNSSSPNMPIKVAAIQSGIDAHYPEYIPRDFALSDITSESGKITLNFKNSSTGDAFTLVEEKVDWTTDDLYTNFIKSNYGDNYVVLSENGFSLYISGSNAAWVKDGIFYKITTTAGSLTKKQLSTIAAKL